MGLQILRKEKGRDLLPPNLEGNVLEETKYACVSVSERFGPLPCGNPSTSKIHDLVIIGTHRTFYFVDLVNQNYIIYCKSEISNL